MTISRWKETAVITATFREPDLHPDDICNIQVWNGPDAQCIEYEMAPIWTGSAPLYRPDGLLSYLETRELLRAEIETIGRIIAAERENNGATVALLTVWECESGWSYIPGEPDEYDAGAQLVGYYKPKTLEYVGL